jgi:hypothetical protein
MNKKNIIYASAFLILLLAVVLLPNSVSGNGKTEIPKFSTTVQLSIAASDEIRNLVHSYLSRELRSLGDVKLVEDNPEWIIDIIASQVKDKTGYVGGVEFSIVIIHRYDQETVEMLLRAVKAALQINSEDWEKLKETKQYADLEILFKQLSDGNRSYIVHHSLRAGSTKDMQTICQEIIADFDTEHLKKERQTFLRAQQEMSTHIEM